MQWTESVGLALVHRDLTSMQLRTPGGQILTYSVLQTFPFTSDSKRMGIIVRVPAVPSPGWVVPGVPARATPLPGQSAQLAFTSFGLGAAVVHRAKSRLTQWRDSALLN